MRTIAIAMLAALFAGLLVCGATAADESQAQLYLITQHGLQGYIDGSGKVVVEPRFAQADEFADEMAAVTLEDGGKWGFINASGKVTIPARYDRVLGFSEGLAAVCSDGKWTFIDKSGATPGKARYDGARSFSDGLAAVRIGWKWGFIDTKMKLAIPARFEGAWPFTEGLAPVQTHGRWGFIDKSGKPVIPARYYWVDNFSEGLAYVEGGKDAAGYVNTGGELVIKGRFYCPNPFTEGVAAVGPSSDDPFILIDKHGAKIADLRYFEVGLFSDGLAPVQAEHKRYIDRTGKVAIEGLFTGGAPFSGDLALVFSDGKMGYIDVKGHYVWGPSDPQRKKHSPSTVRLAARDVLASKIVGPVSAPAKEIKCIGNPQLKRYPDGGPAVLSRSVWDMILYDGRIYTGCGDLLDNTGPIDIYSFAPGEDKLVLEYTAEEEEVRTFYVFDGKLVVPGEDPRESWDLGNIHIKESGKWRKVRTLPHAVHCTSLAYLGGRLYASISTEYGGDVLVSPDWGQSWSHVIFDGCYAGPLSVLAGKLRAFDCWGGLCALQEGIFVPSEMIPRLQELTGNWPNDNNRLRCGPVAAYRNGVLMKTWQPGNEPGKYFPAAAYFLGPRDRKPLMIGAFEGENVTDAIVRGDTAYVLCTHRAAGGFENVIYSTTDLKTWRSVVSFANEAFGASLEEYGGAFYVGLGSGRDMSNPLPKSTGDILRIVPARGRPND